MTTGNSQGAQGTGLYNRSSYGMPTLALLSDNLQMQIAGGSEFTVADLDRAFQGKIQRVHLPWIYRAGLLGVATGLVLLQAVYVAMVALTGWLTFEYVMFIPAIIEAVHVNWITALLIVGPPAVGVIVTFFLFKPLLSRPPKPPEDLQLNRQDAEVLFGFVDRVCDTIGAPPPKRIDVDLQVNASASLRRGFVSFLGNDLKLTIGLPLVAGLTVRQFAGVLAHEFGHFTQTAGMRLYFLIGNVRLWFARVAYERDRWDVWLAENIKTGGWRTRTVLRSAEAAVELSRAILRGLLYVANWMSAWFSRQMEFDADRHEAALVGGETSAEVSLRLPVLSAMCQWAWDDVNESWKYRRLTEDFPVLVTRRDANLVSETRDLIVQSVMGEQTERFATHPATSDRIANVIGITGLLTEPLDQSAASLFLDFGALCRRATDHHYRLSLGDAHKEGTILSSPEFVDEVEAGRKRQEARRTVLSQNTMPSRWFLLPQHKSDGHELTVIVAEVDDSKEYWSTLEMSLSRHAGVEFLRAGGKIQPSSFYLSTQDLAVAEEEAGVARKALQRETDRLRERYGGNGYMLSREATELWQAYSAISAEQPTLLDLRHRYAAAQVLLGNLDFLAGVRGAEARRETRARLRELSKGIVTRLDPVPCPVALPDQALSSVGIQLLPGERPDVFNDMDACDLAARVLARSDDLAELLLGELCVESSKTWRKEEP